MARWFRLVGAASLAAALAAAPAANAQTSGPPEIGGPLNTGPLQTSPEKTKARQTTLQKRAKDKGAKPKEEGRQITVRKGTPSWLTLGGSAAVGSQNGYVVDTFNQPTPIEGTFTGLRGRERITDQFGNPGPGITLFRF
jgi:hypothetical protein